MRNEHELKLLQQYIQDTSAFHVCMSVSCFVIELLSVLALVVHSVPELFVACFPSHYQYEFLLRVCQLKLPALSLRDSLFGLLSHAPA